MEVCKSGSPCFSCQSLLLSTTVLNDIYYISRLTIGSCESKKKQQYMTTE